MYCKKENAQELGKLFETVKLRIPENEEEFAIKTAADKRYRADKHNYPSIVLMTEDVHDKIGVICTKYGISFGHLVRVFLRSVITAEESFTANNSNRI